MPPFAHETWFTDHSDVDWSFALRPPFGGLGEDRHHARRPGAPAHDP
jgi:hypothetical protein